MNRQKLGQHYLVDRKVIDKMISSAQIRPDERILEIGTGRGTLTRGLVKLGASLEGYEVDSRNFATTLEEVRDIRARIHLGDAFRESPRFDVLVSSLPYSRSADFVEWISQIEYDRAVVLLQEDFVAKVMAAPGTRDYRAVSAVAQASSELNVLMKVGRGSFSPQPKVNSLIVSLRPIRRLSGAEVSMFKLLFSLRRREVVSAATELAVVLPMKDYARRRVYSLRPAEVLEICAAQTHEGVEKPASQGGTSARHPDE